MSPSRRQPAAANNRPAGRGARRRSETRSKLVRAARDVMARNGVGAATIQAITEAADVGFGSFYNHFATKEDIVAAVMEEAIETFGAAADRLADAIDDPAEILAASVRHAIRRAAADEAWGWFLVRTALARAHGLRRGLGPRLARDIRRGIEAKRFVVDDPVVAGLAAGGAILSVMATRLHGDIGNDAGERAAAVVLRLLGLSAAEAREIAQRPLQSIPDDGTSAAAAPAARRPSTKL